MLQPRRADVRFGSKADMCSATRDVRFVPIADLAPFIQSPHRRVRARTYQTIAYAALRTRTGVRFCGVTLISVQAETSRKTMTSTRGFRSRHRLYGRRRSMVQPQRQAAG